MSVAKELELLPAVLREARRQFSFRKLAEAIGEKKSVLHEDTKQAPDTVVNFFDRWDRALSVLGEELTVTIRLGGQRRGRRVFVEKP